MNRTILIALSALALLCSCSRKAAKADEVLPFEKRLLVAVADIHNKSGIRDYNGLMEGATGNLIYELHKTQCFRLVERERLKNLLEENKLGMTGLTDPKNTKQIGKILGVDAILFVNLSSVAYYKDNQNILIEQSEIHNYEVTLDSRIVRVETGEIVAAAKQTIPVWYRQNTGLVTSGGKAEPKELVKLGLDEAVQYLAKELAAQTVKNSAK